MKTYNEETLKRYVRIYFLKTFKNKSIQEIRELMFDEGITYTSLSVRSFCSKVKNILCNVEHPQHITTTALLKGMIGSIDIQIPEPTVENPQVKAQIGDQPPVVENKIENSIMDITNSMQSFFDMNKKMHDEKEKVRITIDKLIMSQYMKLSHILGDFYELIISLSKEELDSAILIGDKKQKINNIDKDLIDLKEKSKQILEFKKELNHTFPAPHYWYTYASMLLDDFSYKLCELSAAIDVFKNPYDTDKKECFLGRIKNPFFNLKRMSEANFRYS